MTKGEGIDFCGSLYGNPMTKNSKTHCVTGASHRDGDVSRSHVSSLPFEQWGGRIFASAFVRRLS